jgi:putative multiple sugar transport system permease protein
MADKGLGAHLGGHLRENGMLVALVAIVFFFTVVVRAMIDVDFLSAQNITNLFLQNSYVIIMALGMLCWSSWRGTSTCRSGRSRPLPARSRRR